MGPMIKQQSSLPYAPSVDFWAGLDSQSEGRSENTAPPPLRGRVRENGGQ